MIWASVAKDWNAYRDQFKAKWPKLTEADLDKVSGARANLVSLLKARYGLEKAKADKAIDAFLKTLKKPATA